MSRWSQVQEYSVAPVAHTRKTPSIPLLAVVLMSGGVLFAQPPKQLNPPPLHVAAPGGAVKPGSAFPALPPTASPTAGVWSPIKPGPNTTGGGNASGRITGIAVDPTNNNNIYITAAGGGVWQSTTGGTSWTALTDSQGTLAMGAIAIAPTNNLKIYAGTGEANNSADSDFGLGILHSENGGATWALSTGPSGVFNRLSVGKISVDPAVFNTAYAAIGDYAENGLSGNTGIYKTTDGGVTWTNMTSANGNDSSTPWSDVVVDPNNSAIVYAAHGDIFGTAANGVYRSTNGGSTWSLLSNAPSGAGIGRIALAVAPSASTAGSHVVYVAVATQLSSGNGGLSGMYISSNADAATPTFSLLSNTPDFLGGGNGSGQGWYDIALAVNPTNAANVYAAGAVTYSNNSKHVIQSVNSGASWTDITVGANSLEPHTASHALYFNSAGQVLLGSDGGLWSFNPSNSGWTDLNGNINTIQFTGVGQIGQTNGRVFYSVHPIGSYGASSFMQVSTNGGSSWASATPTISNPGLFDFYPPIFVDPSNGSRVFLGGDALYESTSEGSSWIAHTSPDSSNAINAIAVNPGSNTIYIATGGVSVWISNNDGSTWTAINLPAGGHVNEIDVDPNDATGATAYAVIDQFNGANGQVYKTVNSGASWTNISGNLPQVPTWSLKVDTNSAHTAYVSNETGVYSSTSPYSTWTAYGTGLPQAQGVSLQLNTGLHLLAVGTHGRGTWVTLTPPAPNVSATAPYMVTNTATVAGGGETVVSAKTAADSTNLQAATSSIGYTFPDTALAGGPAFTLYVYGQNFVSGAVVNWNATALATTFSSSGLLTASVPASLITSAGAASITVANPTEMPSNGVTFTIVTAPAVPVFTSGNANYGFSIATGIFIDKLLEFTGSGFQQGATVSWNGFDIGQLLTSPSLVIPTKLVQNPGAAVITVANPGGSQSAPLIITVPAPRTLTTLSPSSASAGSGNFTLTVNGTGFAAGDGITVWPGSFLTATFISPTELQATVPASIVASNATLQVWVTPVSPCCFSSTNELPFTVGTGGPVLSISKSHSGNFYQGEQNATYSVVVSNASGAGASSASSGAVTVTEVVPAGLTLVSMAGTGWTCTLASASCTRSNVLAGGASYPAITVTVNVSAAAPPAVTNEADLSGGGSPTASVYDVTLIASSPGTDLTIVKGHTGEFTEGQMGNTYAIVASNIGASPTSGTVTVSDALPAGLTATAISGTGWNCTLGTLTCTRSDALASGASYPALSLTVNVATNAPALVTNMATVAGGGEINTSNDTATDPTTVVSTSSLIYIFPDTALAGGPGFTLSVYGSGFVSGAVVNWNGTALATTYSSGLLTANVPASLIATAGAASITVTNPTQVPSNAATFKIVISPAVPTFTSGYLQYGFYNSTGLLAGYTLIVTGSGFQQGMTLAWNGTNLGILNSNLNLSVPNSLMMVPGPAVLTLTNPGGAPSAPVTLTIPALPTLTSISPSAVSAGSANFTLTVNGSGFTSGDLVTVWPAYDLSTTFVSSTQLQVTAPASVLVSNGTLEVWVNFTSTSGDFSSTNEIPLTVGTGGPILSIAKAHSGNFAPGQQNATYTLTVSNASATVSTAAAVTVTESAPPGFSLVSMAGSGWTCTLSSATCTRSTVLAGGASYPVITVTGNVSPAAQSLLLNQACVSGGGSPAQACALDPTLIGPLPVLTITKSHTANFYQSQTGATYTVTVSDTGVSTASGTVTVTDTLPTGLTATAISGTGWACTLATLTCTRSDALAAGSSYPAITVTVNVAGNATSPQVNIVTVSGGDSATASAADTTTIVGIGVPVVSVTPSSGTRAATDLHFPILRRFGRHGHLHYVCYVQRQLFRDQFLHGRVLPPRQYSLPAE